MEVRYQDMLLKADEVWGNRLTQDVEGQGHVYFEQGQQKIWGERFKFNLRTKTGSFYQVKGRADPGFIFEAAEVEKIGEDKYRIKDGFVTACEDKVPKWSFSVKDAVFRIDRQVHLKHPIFRIKKLPLFYSPYLYAPTNERERQTGFLHPVDRKLEQPWPVDQRRLFFDPWPQCGCSCQRGILFSAWCCRRPGIQCSSQ